jgi:hypothetical protein
LLRVSIAALQELFLQFQSLKITSLRIVAWPHCSAAKTVPSISEPENHIASHCCVAALQRCKKRYFNFRA